MDIKQKKFYGRRAGKTLTPRQNEALEKIYPEFEIKFPFKTDYKKIALDIGFGSGVNLVAKIQKNPDTFFIAAEPFINGMAQFLAQLSVDYHNQIALWCDDVLDIWDKFEPDSFDIIYLLYPDPWPKARHEKRRFINVENLKKMHSLLKDDGKIDIVSDIPQYLELLRENLKNVPELQISYDSDIAYDYWDTTKYEQKALREGRCPQYITLGKYKLSS